MQKIQEKQCLVFTSGKYTYNTSILINKDNIIVLGVGWPVFSAGSNDAPMFLVSANNCTLASLMIDAGTGDPPALVHFDDKGVGGFLFDITCRILLPDHGTNSCQAMIRIDHNDVYAENIWLWRADHQSGSRNMTAQQWDSTQNPTGLIVNGDGVRIFGLAVEH